jgi:transposase
VTDPLGNYVTVDTPLRDPQHPAAGAEMLTDRQWARLETAFAADEDGHLPVFIAWTCAQQLTKGRLPPPQHHRGTQDRRARRRDVPVLPGPGDRPPRPDAAAVEDRVPGLLRHPPLQQRRHGGINGLIELHRRVARGFRNRENYRLRMLLIGGGLTYPHLK